MKSYYLIIGLIFVLFLYGCSEKEQPQTQEVPPIQGRAVQEFSVIPSCDDNNACTEDIFNELTQECEHKKLERCCGDGVCDMSERCDYTIHSTVCPDDCPRECPPFVVISDWGCDGDCYKTADYYIVNGDTKFKLTLENVGETILADIKSSYFCSVGEGVRYYSDGDRATRNGMIVKSYFNDDEDQKTTFLFLTGINYLQNKGEFTLEFTGTPEKDLRLTCAVRFSANNFYYGTDLEIKQTRIQ